MVISDRLNHAWLSSGAIARSQARHTLAWLQEQQSGILAAVMPDELAVLVQKGRPVGSSGEVQFRYAGFGEWDGGEVERTTNYTDIDEARAAAECAAKEWA
jgi:hypothetical protein